jgi:hypothetical protein
MFCALGVVLAFLVGVVRQLGAQSQQTQRIGYCQRLEKRKFAGNTQGPPRPKMIESIPWPPGMYPPTTNSCPALTRYFVLCHQISRNRLACELSAEGRLRLDHRLAAFSFPED